jgi:O-antigen/teichoic acid export membrane protein
MSPRLLAWAATQRSSVRLALILRIITMVAGAVLSLVWTRLLLRSMGDFSFGVFQSFSAVTRLGGVGDLGITGALAVKVGQGIAREDEKLEHYLPAARALVFLVALVLGSVFLIFSPWLPGWLGFIEGPGTGSLPLLFATGAVGVMIVIITGYFASINLANSTITWPILPTFLFSQVGIAAQWLAVRAGSPLWIQYLILCGFGGAAVVLSWLMLKWTHPWLGNLVPLRYERSVWRDLAGTSGWMYLTSLGTALYSSTDRLIINAGFGAALVPLYQQNGKLCELATQMIAVVGAVSLPKVTRWISSGDSGDRTRVTSELGRMSIFQTTTAIVFALFYLTLNDAFMRFWLGGDYIAPHLWQFAFALNLALACSSNACLNACGLCGIHGIRNTGLAIGLTGLLNAALSYGSMKIGWVAGIAIATVVAQTALSFALTLHTTAYLSMDTRRWLLRTIFLPIGVVTLGYAARIAFPPIDPFRTSLLLAVDVTLSFVAVRLGGMTMDLLRNELRSFRAILDR